MNFGKLTKAFLIGTVVSIFFAGVVSAKEFSDVPQSFWAKDTISEISDKGIVVGYTDGTFKPNREVKRVEVFIILARILGVNAQENADIADQAEQNYKGVLEKYDTYATREISYLLQKKILNQEELDQYLDNGNDEKSMLRREIVPVLVRVMGNEEEVTQKGLVVLDYKDAELIPEGLRAYVEFLGKEGIMMNATDDNKFVPEGAITRAQIVTLVSRLLKKMDTTTTSTNENSGPKYSFGSTVSGAVQNIAVDLGGTKRAITIAAQINDTMDNIVIPISGTVEVQIYGKPSRATLIKAGDFAEIETNEKGEAVKITVEKKDKTVVGIVADVDLEKNTVTVTSEGNGLAFALAQDTRILRNGSLADITKVRKGDNVTLILVYRIVRNLDARGTQSQASGIVNQIIIAKNPKIEVIKDDNNLETFELSKNADINVFSKKADIYSLRLGYKAKLMLDSNEVVSVDAFQQIAGTIGEIVENFNELTLTPKDIKLGESLQLLANQDTKYIDGKTGSEIKITDLKSGQKVLVGGMLSKSTIYVKEITVLE